MVTTIKTSEENKRIVSELTNKFELGTENLIARIALSYSLKSGKKMNPIESRDTGGKEYSKSVLFGNYYPYYLAMICTHYQIDYHNKDIPRYFKMHLDDGLEMINADIKNNPNLIGFDYLLDRIEAGLEEIIEKGDPKSSV